MRRKTLILDPLFAAGVVGAGGGRCGPDGFGALASDPKTQKAFEKCRALLPAFPGRPGGTSTKGGGN